MTLGLVLLLLPLVTADTNLTTWVHSDETINFWTNIQTEGDVNIEINGVDWETQYGNVTVNKHYEVKKIGGTFSVWDMTRHLEDTVRCVTKGKKYCSEWNYRIWFALQSLFLPRREYEQNNMMNEVRLKALENTVELIDSGAYCQGKIDTMIEMDLEWVRCGENKYVNLNGIAILVQGIG